MKRSRKILLLPIISILIATVSGYLWVKSAADLAVREADLSLSDTDLDPILAYEGPPIMKTGVKVMARLKPFHAVVEWGSTLALAAEGGVALVGPNDVVVLNGSHGLTGGPISDLAVLGDQLVAGGSQGISIITRDRIKTYRFRENERNKITRLVRYQAEVLIGSHDGLAIYDGASFLRHPVDETLQGAIVTAISPYQDGLAIGTWDQGLILADEVGVRSIPPEQIGPGPINAICEYEGGLLLGGPLNLIHWDGKNSKALLRDVYIEDILIEGSILAVGEDQMVVYSPEKSLMSKIPLKAHRLARMGEEIWTLGEDGIKSVGNGPRAERTAARLVTKEPLTDNFIVSVEAPGNGELWLGLFDRGVDVLDRDLNLVAHLEESGFEDVNCVRHILSREQTYVGSHHGALVYRGRQLVGRITTDDGLIGEVVFDVIEMSDGALVFATNRGVTFQTVAGWRSIYTFHGLANNHVYCLAEFDGKLFAGTLGGLSMIEGNRVTRNFTVDNSKLRHNWITSLLPVGNRLYIGTFGGGMSAINSAGDFIGLGPGAEYANINNSAMIMIDNKIVSGAFAEGLMVYDPGSEKWLTGGPRLGSNNVMSLIKWDSNGGRVAVGADSGLSLFGWGEADYR
jgi:ligand-binding sensor domain-containing protein